LDLATPQRVTSRVQLARRKESSCRAVYIPGFTSKARARAIRTLPIPRAACGAPKKNGAMQTTAPPIAYTIEIENLELGADLQEHEAPDVVVNERVRVRAAHRVEEERWLLVEHVVHARNDGYALVPVVRSAQIAVKN
jgi:hypothetical protein